MERKEILNKLDNSYRKLDFPALNNANMDMAQTRLSVFRNEEDWLLAIEVVGFNGDHYNQVFGYGSKCKDGGIIYAEEVLFFPEYPIDDDGNFLISPYDIHVFIKDEEIRIRPTKADYQAAGIDPEPFGQVKMLRLLCYLYGDKFWIDDKTILQSAGMDLKMPLFFRTKQWRHPNVTSLERPSQNEFFKQLALAVEKNDPSIIEIKDPNTHWSNWID